LTGGDDHSAVWSGRREQDIRAIEERTARSAFGMGHLLIGGLSKARLDFWQVKQIVVFATHNPGQATLGDIGSGCSIPRESIQPGDSSIERKVLTAQRAGDDPGCAKSCAARVSLACPREASQPVVRVGLEDRR
jgi:hypothetical protein